MGLNHQRLPNHLFHWDDGGGQSTGVEPSLGISSQKLIARPLYLLPGEVNEGGELGDPFLRLGRGSGAAYHPALDPMEDGGDAEEIERQVEIIARHAIAPGAAAIGGEIVFL